MGIEGDVEQIEIDIDQAKKQIAMADALRRLDKNKDFQMVVKTGYFRDEAARLVLLRSDQSMVKDDDQVYINKLIDGVGGIRMFFHTIFHLGRMAEKALADQEQTRQELLEEGLEDEVH